MFFELYLSVMMLLVGVILGLLIFYLVLSSEYNIWLNRPDKLTILDIVKKERALVIFPAAFLCSVAWPITILVALIIYFCRALEH